MIRMLGALDLHRYAPRLYVLADSDAHSERKLLEFESKHSPEFSSAPNDSKEPLTNAHSSTNTFSTQVAPSNVLNTFKVFRVPRSREVRQSYISSVFSTLRASLHAFPLVFTERPDLLLCNGPGTCIPICVAFCLLRV